ncbi:MAG TPA: hypothetical protein VNA88_07910 [Candidatus Kapabacteria bacterium]|nr:hypothetical protein [Candidatus Kapabacteria bacterium]
MSLPWWLDGYEPDAVERVLRCLAIQSRLQLEGIEADIASRLLRNGYVRGELESTVVGADGPLAIELESRGLSDLGGALLARIAHFDALG